MKSPRILFLPLAFLLALNVGTLFAQQKASAEDQAIAFHRARAESRGDDADAWRMLAAAYVQRAEATGDPADYDRASGALDRAEQLEPQDLRTLRGRATMLASRHRFPQALALAESGLQKSPEDVELLRIAGDTALEQGEVELADGYYQRAHKLSPRLSEWARLAHIAEIRGKLDEAAGLLEKAMQSGQERGAPPESISWCRAVLGEVELKRGRPAEARKLYEQALETTPDHPLALEHLAELEHREGNLAAAEMAYRKILRGRPNPEVQLALAGILDSLGKKEEAARLRNETRSFLEKAVAAGHEGFLRPLAQMEFSAGRYQRAVALAARDLVLRPNAESRSVFRKILQAAAEAGQPVTDLWKP
jgi:tetratricopeptide (TPR) repeat protein